MKAWKGFQLFWVVWIKRPENQRDIYAWLEIGVEGKKEIVSGKEVVGRFWGKTVISLIRCQAIPRNRQLPASISSWGNHRRIKWGANNPPFHTIYITGILICSKVHQNIIFEALLKSASDAFSHRADIPVQFWKWTNKTFYEKGG